MALGERAVLAGVEVERVSLFGFRVGAEVLNALQVSQSSDSSTAARSA